MLLDPLWQKGSPPEISPARNVWDLLLMSVGEISETGNGSDAGR
jgi:hypothetical protein